MFLVTWLWDEILLRSWSSDRNPTSSPCLGPVLKSLAKEKTCFPKDNHYLSPSALTLDYEIFGPPSKW